MFYEGGSHGQKGFVAISGFMSMPVTVAAQSAQHSPFPDAYSRGEPLARQIVGSPAVWSASCYSAADYVGDGSSGAKAVAAALQFLGTPCS